MMLTLVLIGSGNVATHLFNAFSAKKDIVVKQVFSRNVRSLEFFKDRVKTTTSLNELSTADVYILAISDSAIENFSKKLPFLEGLIVHTSGSMPLSILHQQRCGVFYPLQTFTKNKPIDFTTIPICIEAKNEKDLALLEKLGKSISDVVHPISSQQRAKLHLSAVLVNNFTNHLFHWANELCQKHEIPFSLLQPLISETVDKIKYLSPLEAQTGPARRNDIATMQQHIAQLEHPLQKKIYQLLSESIKSFYEKEL